jgi:N-acetylglucosamine-6-phosphate deacetylase
VTVVTAALSTYEHVLPLLTQLAEHPPYANHILGFHLEGPFLSPHLGAKGAHNPGLMQMESAVLVFTEKIGLEG